MSRYGRIKAYEQQIFINTGILYGIQSYSIDPQYGNNTLKYLGVGNQSLFQILNSPQYIDLSINAVDVSSSVLQGTGDIPINCYIFSKKQDINSVYSLVSGSLNQYSVKYAPNQIPQVNASYRFFNNGGQIPTGNLAPHLLSDLTSIISNTYPIFDNYISNSNYINLQLAEYSGNRVIDFNFSIDINRTPIYNLGNRYPKNINTIFPININCEFTFEPDPSFIDNSIGDFPQLSIKQNIIADIYSNQSNKIMFKYAFQNMTMISEKRGATVDGNLSITRKYLGQIFNFNNYITGNGTPPFTGGIWDFGFVIASPDFYVDWGDTSSIPTGGFDFGSV